VTPGELIADDVQVSAPTVVNEVNNSAQARCDVRSQQRFALHAILVSALPLGGVGGFAIALVAWYLGDPKLIEDGGWVIPMIAGFFLLLGLVFNYLARIDIRRLKRLVTFSKLNASPVGYSLVPAPSIEYKVPYCCAVCTGPGTRCLATTIRLGTSSSVTTVERARFMFCESCSALALHVNAAIQQRTSSTISMVSMIVVGLEWVATVRDFREAVGPIAAAWVVVVVFLTWLGRRKLFLPPVYAVESPAREGSPKRQYLGFVSERYAQQFARMNGEEVTPWRPTVVPVHPFAKTWAAFTRAPQYDIDA
jgi:hypothetical protein